MSGFEVAGVILGSIPLLVSTIENYKNGLRTIQRWRRHDRELQSLVRNLKTERVKLQNVCEKLLDGLIPPSQIDAMVENLGGALWSDPMTQRRIRQRLWRSWDIFEETLKEIETAIVEMGARLDTGRDITWSDKLLPVKELKRASFALSWSTYAELLNTIQEGVSNLEKLANLNVELEPQRRLRSRIRVLNILRDLCCSIFRAVSSNLTCTCTHRICMRLTDCTTEITPIDDEKEILQSLKIHLALSMGRIEAQDPLPPKINQRWEQLMVQASPYLPPQWSSMIPKVSDPTLGLEKQRKRGVRFSLSRLSTTLPTASCTQTDISVVTSSLMRTMNVDAEPAGRPESKMNLCGVLASPSKPEFSPSCLGMISDQLHQDGRNYAVYSAREPVPENEKLTMVSLQEVLEDKKMQTVPTYKQRLQLAVLVATSVLQCYNTPWLPDVPSIENIFFIKTGNQPLFEKTFILADPNRLKDKSNHFLSRNPTLLALGVLLVELLRGHTMDELRTPEEVLSADMRPLANYMTARRLLSEVSQTSSN